MHIFRREGAVLVEDDDDGFGDDHQRGSGGEAEEKHELERPVHTGASGFDFTGADLFAEHWQ